MNITEYENKNISLKGYDVKYDNRMNVIEPLMSNNHATLFVGTPGSGKSSLVINLLSNYYNNKKNPQFSYIYYYNHSLNTIDEKFLSKLNKDRVFTSLSNIDNIVEQIKESPDDRSIIIIDDLVYEIPTYQNTIMRIIQNRRHLNCCLWIITQKLNLIPLRIRSQFDSIYFWSFSNKRELETLFNDYITLDREEFDLIINYIYNDQDYKPHTFLFIDKLKNAYYKNFNLLKINGKTI